MCTHFCDTDHPMLRAAKLKVVSLHRRMFSFIKICKKNSLNGILQLKIVQYENWFFTFQNVSFSNLNDKRVKTIFFSELEHRHCLISLIK